MPVAIHTSKPEAFFHPIDRFNERASGLVVPRVGLSFRPRVAGGAVPDGHVTPQQIFTDKLYEIHYRFLETEDEYFDYAPARQGLLQQRGAPAGWKPLA